MIDRLKSKQLTESLDYFPVVALIGPRQCGKTTLAKQLLASIDRGIYLDLENATDLSKLDDPFFFFRQHEDVLICLDEIQRVPELFSVLRSHCDRTGRAGQFLILGSASPDLLHQSSESLAGRIHYIELTPFLLRESGENTLLNLWVRGGFPRSYMAPSDSMSLQWRMSFIRTFLERDLPQLGIKTPTIALRRFWQMCAHNHGSLWNAEKIGQSLDITGKTVRHYLDILNDSFVLRSLPPYYANIKKRLVKSQKVYIRDSGLLHGLLQLEQYNDLAGHPVLGASWEGFVVEQLTAASDDSEHFFYRTAAGAEIDLIIKKGQHTIAVEAKASSAPTLKKGFTVAVNDIAPDETWVVAPVEASYPLRPDVHVMTLHDAQERLLAR